MVKDAPFSPNKNPMESHAQDVSNRDDDTLTTQPPQSELPEGSPVYMQKGQSQNQGIQAGVVEHLAKDNGEVGGQKNMGHETGLRANKTIKIW